MKIAIILLDYLRHDYTQRVKDHNLPNAGYDFDLITVDRKGIAHALNEGLQQAKEHDAIVTMANDILMPPGWLKAMVEATKRIPHTGMVGIHTVETLPPVNRYGVHETWCPFGNALITRAALDAVGYFNTNFGMYGMEDSDFGYRVSKSGFISYYLPNLRAEHIGHDVGNGSEYRRQKDESLGRAGHIYGKAVDRYDSTGDYYLPLNQSEIWADGNTINMKQTLDELQ